MPYVNIKVTDEQVTKEQKRLLIEGTTQLLVEVLNKNPKTTFDLAAVSYYPNSAV